MVTKNNFLYILSLIFFLISSCQYHEQRTNKNQLKDKKETLIRVNNQLLKKDYLKIDKYIERRKWKMKKSQTGLYYSILKEGKGKKVQKDNIVSFNYTLTSLNGNVYYSSDTLGLKTFRVGHGNVETGLEEAVLMLSEGAKARFIMPPHLAHGLVGDGNKISYRTTIIYDIELISCKK